MTEIFSIKQSFEKETFLRNFVQRGYRGMTVIDYPTTKLLPYLLQSWKAEPIMDLVTTFVSPLF